MYTRAFFGPVTALLVALLVSAPSSAQSPSVEPTDWDQVRLEHVVPLSVRAHTAPSVQVTPDDAGHDRLRGALWGAGVGLVAGGLLGGLTVGSSGDGDDFGGSLVEASATGEAVVMGALAGAVLGALLGATVFAPAHRLDGGTRADSGVSATPITSSAGFGVALRVRR